MPESYPGAVVRLKHAPLWFGVLKSIFGNVVVVSSLPGSEIPDVGGWPLPIDLLEVVPQARGPRSATTEVIGVPRPI